MDRAKTPQTAGPRRGVPAPPGVRPLRSAEDFEACLALQRRTWGEDFTDLVPAHLMKVAQRIGGVAAGAFDESGEMLGFVFGMTGMRDGAFVHWSDMLAVREEARGRGIGRLLKEHQREAMRELGVGAILWTYDPLVARNAHLNLARLGARATEYVRDMYPSSNSPLHRGMGTDRFVVSWSTADEPDRRAPPAASAVASAPVINTDAAGEPIAAPTLDGAAPVLRVEIPPDIHSVLQADPARAVAWRESTRSAFQAALAAGYDVATFVRDPGSGRCYYVLDRVHPGSGGTRAGG